MTEMIATCVLWLWTPGVGNTYFEFFVSGAMFGTTTETQITICQGDIPLDQSLTLWVDGLNESAPERRLSSNTVEAKWIWNADFNADGIVDMADFGLFGAHWGKNDTLYDADGDGTVGFSDYGKFTKTFGQCNNGLKVIPCP